MQVCMKSFYKNSIIYQGPNMCGAQLYTHMIAPVTEVLTQKVRTCFTSLVEICHICLLALCVGSN